MDLIKRVRIVISGNAQRVGFRHKASQAALALGITGNAMYVDQSLIIEAEGNASDLGAFISWCHKGPDGCIIDNIEVDEIEKLQSKSFDIVPGVLASEPLVALNV
jgi:acylphosphatase